MSEPFRNVAENLARRTSRRGLFGRSAQLIFGVLAGTAAGAALRAGDVGAGGGTACSFPYGQPCSCADCQSSGVCAKPCVILTTFYATGCWVTTPAGQATVTCCDCDCPDQPD